MHKNLVYTYQKPRSRVITLTHRRMYLIDDYNYVESSVLRLCGSTCVVKMWTKYRATGIVLRFWNVNFCYYENYE